MVSPPDHKAEMGYTMLASAVHNDKNTMNWQIEHTCIGTKLYTYMLVPCILNILIS